MELYIDNRTLDDFTDKHEKIVNQTILEVLIYEEFSDNVEISLSIVNEEEIKQINKKFRNVDKSTDVLSFPLIDFNEEYKPFLADDSIMLGDIIICWDKLTAQAETYGHSIERELGFLTAHSMLHLLGYDHIDPKEEKEMFLRQENILERVGLTR